MPKLLRTKCILAVLVAALGVLTVPALAGFVSGVERFDGKSLDLTTWEAYPNSAMSQADSLTIDARTIAGADYSTASIALNVGQAVSVEVTPRLMHEGAVGLYLSNDSAGTSVRMFEDTQFCGLAWWDDFNAIITHTTGGDNLIHIVEGDHPLNTTYIYRIDRPNAAQIVLSVYSADGTLLGSQTVSALEFTAGPYVSLLSYNALASFCNVRILNAGDPQPVPTAAPTFSPDSGQYVPSATVTISCATPGATIYYTTNGSEPSDTNGTPISSGSTVLVDQNTLLKARAYVGVEGSSVKEATYITTSSSFVDGVDRFNGIVLDPYTWESFYDYIASMKLRFSQNDALTIDARPIAGQDYTTVSQTVGVGQAVSVEVTPTVLGGEPRIGGLYLTNNSGGSSVRTYDDSQWQGLAWVLEWGYIGTHGSTDNATVVAAGNHPLYTTYIYRIDRPSATQAVFSVYSTDGTLLGSQTLTLPEFTAGPYVSLASYQSINTFDNVRIMNAGDPQPLPAVVEIPAFSPDQGSYATAQPVTIACTTPGATIKYTTDGSDPSTVNGTVIASGGTILVDHSMILKARAFLGGDVSLIRDALYYIGVGSLARPSALPSGTATIDGDLSEWAGAEWAPLDQDYNGMPIDIAEAYYTARWQAEKVYVAVKVRDTDHFFTDGYIGWDQRDAVELYIHTTGMSLNEAYSTNQAAAQQYVVGVTNSDRTAVWTAIGGDGFAVPGSAGFSAAGKEDGPWLYYEAAITPFRHFADAGGGWINVVSPLIVDQIIGLDVAAVARDIIGYTGMKAENLMLGKFNDYGQLGLHRLVSAPINLPVVGANNKAVLDAIMTQAAPNYIWVLWGKVSNLDAQASTFDIDDGSGVTIHITSSAGEISSAGIGNGNYVAVRGTLNADTQTLISSGITKYN